MINFIKANSISNNTRASFTFSIGTYTIVKPTIRYDLAVEQVTALLIARNIHGNVKVVKV